MNKTEIINELKNWKQQFEEIFEMVDGFQNRLSGREDLTVIAKRYAELKSRLDDYDHQLKNARQNGQLNDDEQTVLAPAIHEIVLYCSARSGSMDQQELRSSLFDAVDYLSYYSSELRHSWR